MNEFYNEIEIVKKIYEYVSTNSPNPITKTEIMKKFNLKREDFLYFLHIMQYKYNLPFLFEFNSGPKYLKKAICRFCFKNSGMFREMKIKRSAKGTKLIGEFICDECYNEKIINKK